MVAEPGPDMCICTLTGGSTRRCGWNRCARWPSAADQPLGRCRARRLRGQPAVPSPGRPARTWHRTTGRAAIAASHRQLCGPRHLRSLISMISVAGVVHLVPSYRDHGKAAISVGPRAGHGFRSASPVTRVTATATARTQRERFTRAMRHIASTWAKTRQAKHRPGWTSGAPWTSTRLPGAPAPMG
jgi:hypothetical protein